MNHISVAANLAATNPSPTMEKTKTASSYPQSIPFDPTSNTVYPALWSAYLTAETQVVVKISAR